MGQTSSSIWEKQILHPLTLRTSDLEYIPKKRKGLFETFPSFGPCFIAVFYLQGLICLSDYLSSLSIYLLIPLFTLLFIHFPCYHMFYNVPGIVKTVFPWERNHLYDYSPGIGSNLWNSPAINKKMDKK